MLQYHVAQRGDDFVVLELSGELSGHLWTEQLRQALEAHFVDDGVRRIRVDLSPVRFLDNHGVATLLALFKESVSRGKRFVVERADGQVRDKLEVTGVLDVLGGRS